MNTDLVSFVVVVTCLGVILYHHIAYPVLLRLFAERRRARVAEAAAAAAAEVVTLPSIALIVPAHNEERYIAAKIANLAKLDYPADLLDIVIALDGCTDATRAIAEAEIAKVAGSARIRLVNYATNKGKIAVLNEQIAEARADIIALSDASSLVEPGTLRKAARHFAGANVGVVCPTYRLQTAGSDGERAYWEYQTRIKADEAALAAPMGAHGAFYLFRRALWSPMAPDTINDDFILPMKIVLKGYRAVYDRDIVATELEASTAQMEFRRRMRIGAGNMQQAIRLANLANPRLGWLAFVFLSGKALRPMVPFLLLVAVASTGVLAYRGNPVFGALFAFELAVLGCAALVIWQRRLARVWPFGLLGYAVEGHTASFLGAMTFLLGKPLTAWQPQARAFREEPRYVHATYVPVSVAFGKRALDIACALGALALLLILFLPIALAIRLTSRGPIFYRQLRVGRVTPEATHLFELIKFRSMRVDAEVASGPVWASENDPRITKVGAFLRKSRLDELPQCINVLRGDMSVVGPRPERPGFFRMLEENIPFYVERTYELRPGITGLAQINQQYDSTIEDVRNKVMYDHAYAMHLATWLSWVSTDVSIILRTFRVMIFAEGR